MFYFQVPVQRVTKYPLLLSRLLKVTPAHHLDRSALQESRERIEHHLENMNQEARDTNSTRLWRRISMINVSSYRKMDSQEERKLTEEEQTANTQDLQYSYCTMNNQ